MTKRENRDTYLSEQEVLGRVIDTSDKISHFLAELRQQADDERSCLHLDNLIALQSELTTRIAEYRHEAPWQVSNTFVQYVDPGSGKIGDMMRTHGGFKSINDTTTTVVALNNELARQLENVSINEGIPESRDAFDNLQEMVRDTSRRMSMDASMSGDL